MGRGGSAGEREGQSGGWEVGPAGGRAAAAAAGVSGATGCGADVAPSDPQPSRARPREPRAPAVSERRRRLRQPVPGHVAAATARKTASAEQVESAPLRPGKVSPAAVRGSWRGVRPPSLEGKGLLSSVPLVLPAAASPGTWRPRTRFPRRLLGKVGVGMECAGRIPGRSWGSLGPKFYLN